MVLFAAVAQTAEEAGATSSRLKKRAAIEAGLTAAAQGSVPEAGLFALYLAGQPFAENDTRKLNAGGALLSRAVLSVSGATDAALHAAYRRHGDLGAAAFDLFSSHTPGQPALTLHELSTSFASIATARTTAVRAALVEGLLRRCTPLEAKYLLKLMLGDMRIGVKQSLVEEAIAFAATTAGHATDAAAVRHAVMLEADLGRAVERAFAGTLAEARMTLFHCLGFMLASPVETPEEAVARFTEPPPKPEKKPKPKRRKKGEPEELAPVDAAEEALAEDIEAAHRNVVISTDPHHQNFVISTEAQRSGETCSPQPPPPPVAPPPVLALVEDKYDGMRAQVHCGDPSQPGRVVLYSRNREDITHSFPELAEAFAHVNEPLIFDGEILGWNYATSQALPFAVLGQRIGRKVVTNDIRSQIPVVFMAFDLLYAGGDLLLPLPLAERRARLETVFSTWSESTISPLTVDPADKRPQVSLFTADTPQPEARPRLMLSPTQRVSGAEAIDLAYRDARARANEGVMLKAANSAYLPGRRGLAWVKLKRELATLDVVITGAEYGHGKRAGLLSDYTFAVRGPEGELLNVGKAYSGVTDAEILELTEWLKAHTLEDQGYFRTVEPIRVLEVAFNNVMRSTRHASGFALRFPRILRIRDDKPLSEIDTLDRVEEIYQSQPDRPEEPE